MSASELHAAIADFERRPPAPGSPWAQAEAEQDAPSWRSSEPLHVVDIHSFLCMDIPPREMVLSPWLPSQGLAMIYARRGAGKTYLALTIAYAVASGGAVLGWSAPKPRKVLYLDGEMLAAPLQERLAAIAATSEKEPLPGMLNIITPDLQKALMPDLATVGGQAALAAVTPADTRLIIVDSLSSLVRGEARENDAESWQPVADWALSQRVAGRSVLFLHHAGKSGSQRGTSKREDLLDSVLALKPVADHSPHSGAKFEVCIEKSRALCPDFQPLECELRLAEGGGVAWQFRPVQESVADRIFDLFEAGMSKREIAEELGVNRSTVYRTLARGKGER
ncbi:MAG TPA: AAA family ATPase [Terriglobia bacterium]|nr:AAA family ATPase [Terriglobia bacterium]